MSTAIEYDLTETEKWLLAILPRIAASVSIVCTIWMIRIITCSASNLARFYHRLMLGCAVSTFILNTAQLWGQAAAPEGTDHVIGAAGNETTCTIQGFMYQFRFVQPSLYFALAFWTRRQIRLKFTSQDASNYRVQEVMIHVGVYIFPIASGIYIWSLEGFNMISQGCGMSSEPPGCGGQEGDDYIECTRGPSNMSELQFLFGGLPAVLVVCIPSIMMIALFIRLRRDNYTLVACSLARQSMVYLLSILGIYIFRWIDVAMLFGLGRYVFVTNLIAEITDPLQGLWTLLIYLYFRSSKKSRSEAKTAREYQLPLSGEEGSSDNPSKTSGVLPKSPGRRSYYHDYIPEFSIFDGSAKSTDGQSPWAQFLHDEGEDADYSGGYSDQDFQLNSDPSITRNPTFARKSSQVGSSELDMIVEESSQMRGESSQMRGETS